MLGSTIGPYRILQHLGAGGMGVVYRAHDDRLDRDVALKFLPSSTVVDDTARARLLREARSASALNHPNISQIYEIGQYDGQDFIAMEMVEGTSLAQRIGGSGLPVATAIGYGIQIADALAHAHERGVIHRDLKSANVMITPEGRAKVLDFGLAKRTQSEDSSPRPGEASLTGTGMVVGTPSFLAPEVLAGDKATAQSDVWALGVVLYEMITGHLPFQGRNWIELSSAIVHDEPAPLPPRVPNGLRAIIRRCLAKDPSGRYRSASEVRAGLEAVEFDSTEQRARVGSSRPNRRLVVAGALGLVGVVALAAWLLDAGGLRSAASGLTSGAKGAPRIRSLAVLPLANLSGDPQQDYFAAGMTEELITNLAPIRDLKVISRTSVMRYKGTEESIPRIARELKVDGIVEGSVTRAGNRVRITAQLIDAPRDKHIWARSYERDLEDVLTLQRDVARDIAQEIQVRLSPQETASMSGGRPVNPRAYELYLKGLYEWGKLTPEGTDKAIEYYQQAIAIDPSDARSYAGLANSYLIQGYLLATVPLPVAMPKVKEYSRKALALDATRAEAHAAMAAAVLFTDWDFTTAERELRRAIELNPGLTGAHLVYSVYLGILGRTDEALDENQRALELDPLSLINNWNLIYVYGQRRQFDEAVAQAKRTLELFPNSQIVETVLFRVYEWKHDYASALDVVEHSMPAKEVEGRQFLARLRKAYATGSRESYLRGWLEFYKSRAAGNPAYNGSVALTYARLGDRDRAFEWLDRVVAARQSDALWLQADPDFDSLRTDPRYPALVRRIGFPAAD